MKTQILTQEQKQKLLREYFHEQGKKSVESRRLKMGAEGFKKFMKKIGRKGGKTKRSE